MEHEKPLPIGTRVVCVAYAEEKTLHVFGRGTFEGFFLAPQIDVTKSVAEIMEAYKVQQEVTPDLPPTFTEQDAKTALLLSSSSPRIRLTEDMSGNPMNEEVWGYECWFNTEEVFKDKSVGYTTVQANLVDERKKHDEAEQLEEKFKAAILNAQTATGGGKN
jgi:hypothetical protein